MAAERHGNVRARAVQLARPAALLEAKQVDPRRTLRRIEESAFDPNSRWRIANVAAVRANRQPLRNLARRLEDANQAVTPAGMLRATHLITDGSSPLYNPAKTQQLERFIESTIELLEPRTATRAA
jgi:hypothetical protein